jgi:hypothetical protein
MPGGFLREELHDRIRELHAEGLGRNAIAREIGEAPVMVSRTVAHLKLTFDRTKIQAAADARRADVEERRSLLAERFVAVAEESLDRLARETTVYAFGGKANEYNDHIFGEAPIAERQKLITAAAIAVDKSLKLMPPVESAGLDDAKSMLGSLGAALTAFSRAEDERESEQAEGEQA